MIAGAVGFLGAGAFNPDSGFLFHSEALWGMFGLATYVGFAAVVLLLLLAAISVVMHAAGRLVVRLASPRRGAQRER